MSCTYFNVKYPSILPVEVICGVNFVLKINSHWDLNATDLHNRDTKHFLGGKNGLLIYYLNYFRLINK
jgi:hypothetical protein